MSSWNKTIIRRPVFKNPEITTDRTSYNQTIPVTSLNDTKSETIDMSYTNNVCLLILNCKKYTYKRNIQIHKWLGKFPLKYWFHIQGDPNINTDFKINEKNHLMYVKVEDNYVSLPKKIYSAIKAINDTYPHITHILKTDDDMDIDINKFHYYLPSIVNNDYGGFINDVPEHLSDHHIQFHKFEIKGELKLEKCKAAICTNGRFYFLSKKCMKHIINCKSLFWESLFEDNTIGFALQSLPDKKILRIPDYEIFKEYVN